MIVALGDTVVGIGAKDDDGKFGGAVGVVVEFDCDYDEILDDCFGLVKVNFNDNTESVVRGCHWVCCQEIEGVSLERG